MRIPELSADCGADDIVNAMRRDGACIVRDALSEDTLARLDADLAPWIDRTETGPDAFSGRRTKRTGVARTAPARPASGSTSPTA